MLEPCPLAFCPFLPVLCETSFHVTAPSVLLSEQLLCFAHSAESVVLVWGGSLVKTGKENVHGTTHGLFGHLYSELFKKSGPALVPKYMNTLKRHKPDYELGKKCQIRLFLITECTRGF